MCGLPGSGKTHYVENFVKENPDKNYSVLGTSSLMKRMKVSILPLMLMDARKQRLQAERCDGFLSKTKILI